MRGNAALDFIQTTQTPESPYTFTTQVVLTYILQILSHERRSFLPTSLFSYRGMDFGLNQGRFGRHSPAPEKTMSMTGQNKHSVQKKPTTLIESLSRSCLRDCALKDSQQTLGRPCDVLEGICAVVPSSKDRCLLCVTLTACSSPGRR